MTMTRATPSLHATSSLRTKVGLVGALVFALVLVSSSRSSGDHHDQHSVVLFRALKKHEPSLRIFQSLFEINVLCFCAALSLWLWSKIVHTSLLSLLLFQPVEDSSSSMVIADTMTSFRPSCDKYDDDNVMLLAEEENNVLDADYASDGSNTSEPDDNHANHAGFAERSSSSDDIPSASAVLNVALDLLLTILVALFLFTLSSSTVTLFGTNNKIGKAFSRVAAPTFPLLLFCYLGYKTFFPWRQQRRSFWIVVSYTLGAPWQPVTFRDGFVGDILTSSVRPMQDITFTVFYILFGLRGWWSQSYQQQEEGGGEEQAGGDDGSSSLPSSFVTSADASVPYMERSWLLHTVVLPMCMISPLWWRFLQNLRQCYDNRQRWPYLGNALKYFVAAQVAVFGVYTPSLQQSPLWLSSFVVATLYQIWWDVFMDWGLVERTQSGQWRLRRQRLYATRVFYWAICWSNVVLRFCWTLNFIPLRYLNTAGVLTDIFSGDRGRIVGPIIAIAEIIRRTMWGWLRLEWEAVKESPNEACSELKNVDAFDRESNMKLEPMKIQDDGFPRTLASQRSTSLSDMSKMDSMQVLAELSLYAATFCLVGFAAAAHRGTF